MKSPSHFIITTSSGSLWSQSVAENARVRAKATREHKRTTLIWLARLGTITALYWAFWG
jgi:hypothetical protein